MPGLLGGAKFRHPRGQLDARLDSLRGRDPRPLRRRPGTAGAGAWQLAAEGLVLFAAGVQLLAQVFQRGLLLVEVVFQVAVLVDQDRDLGVVLTGGAPPAARAKRAGIDSRQDFIGLPCPGCCWRILFPKAVQRRRVTARAASWARVRSPGRSGRIPWPLPAT